MNEYKQRADFLRATIEQNPDADTSDMQRKLKALDLLAVIPADLIPELYNTGVFNKYAEAFAVEALERLNYLSEEERKRNDQLFPVNRVNVNDFRRELARVHDEFLAEELTEDDA